MTERTLRDRIAALLVHPTRDQDDMVYNLAIGDALAALDAHTAAQPAPDAVAEATVCRCGVAMSKNPHPDAGKPFTLLETGPVWVCIPCQSGTLHRWAERANAAENRIAAAQEALAKGPSA